MRGRLIPAIVLVGVLVTACGTSEPTSSVEPSPTGQVADLTTGEDGSVSEAATSTTRRELGLAVRPESDVDTNPLPWVQVHDVGQDRMVNFRNIFPAERPVLLWMWAPF